MVNAIPKRISGLWTFWNREGRKIEDTTIRMEQKGNWAFWDLDGKSVLGKIDYETFKNIGSFKHLDGVFLVTGPIDGANTVYKARSCSQETVNWTGPGHSGIMMAYYLQKNIMIEEFQAVNTPLIIQAGINLQME